MIQVECPGCRQRLTFRDEQAGKTAKCNKCGCSFALPQFAPRPTNQPAAPLQRSPQTKVLQQGPGPDPEPPNQPETTALVRILERVASVLIPVVAIYFLAGALLATAAVQNTIRGEDQGDAIARDTGDSLSWFYQRAFEPVNRPVRPFLPREGRYHLFDIGNRFFYLDVAPVVAGFIVLLVLVLGFGLVGTVLKKITRTT